MPERAWLLFVSQLPASPSSLRVMVWRRMRAAGALGLQNGVWVLPRRKEHERFLQELMANVGSQEGSAQIFIAHAVDEKVAADITARLQADRSQEYQEFAEQCASLREEIDKETRKKKFSFPELEENEDNLERLTRWLAKISSRDFFPGDGAAAASAALEGCREALASFADRVYSHEGVTRPERTMSTRNEAHDENK